MSIPEPAIAAPHQGGVVRTAGADLPKARAAMLMVHGRGATAEDILSLASELDLEGLACLAPQAAGNIWYPNPFTALLSQNEPWLSSALAFLGDVHAAAEKYLPSERIFFLGFSQGACLALEYSARHARRYGGVIGLSGALIGPAEDLRDYSGSLAGTPVFLGCSDVDPYIPQERVDHAAGVLQRLGGQVTERLYPDMPHMVNQDELEFVQALIQGVLKPS